jgi:hypothetical protein
VASAALSSLELLCDILGRCLGADCVTARYRSRSRRVILEGDGGDDGTISLWWFVVMLDYIVVSEPVENKTVYLI